MTDLAAMTGRDLLDWLGLHGGKDSELDETVTAVHYAAAAGVGDLDAVMNRRSFPLIRELESLTEKGTADVAPPLTVADLDTLLRVGWRVYAQDRENVTDWVAVADRIDVGAREAGWNHQGHHTGRPVPSAELIDAILDVGRGPTYAQQIISAAEQTRKLANAYGFADITPAQFRDLAEAGVPNRAALDAYGDAFRAAGLPDVDRTDQVITRAVPLAHAKVAAGPALAAARTGVPVDPWPTLLAGIPGSWFPISDGGWTTARLDPVEKGALKLGFTFEDLRYLADRGWADVVRGPEDLTGGYELSKLGGVKQHWGPAGARWLADHGLTPAAVAAYAEALTRGGQQEGQPKALLGHPRWADDRLPDVVALADAGVRPSHLPDYRWSGCKTVQDVLDAAAAGIDGRRVKALREQYGETKSKWDKSKRIPSLRRLLELHERTTP